MSSNEIEEAGEMEGMPEMPESAAAESAEHPGMDDEELLALLGTAIDDSIAYRVDELGPEREQALNYFNALPFGTEEEGRSKIVQSVVRDTIRATMPSLMRIFLGGESVCEFMPTKAANGELADAATDMVNHVLMVANPGFEVIHSALHDGLLLRNGWVKWWPETDYAVESKTMTGLTEDEVMAVAADAESYEIIGARQEIVDGQPVRLLDCRVTRKKPRVRYMVRAIPNEEILYSRNARSVEDADFFCHRSRVTKSQLLSMGLPEEVVEESFENSAGSDAAMLESMPEKIARQPGSTSLGPDALMQTVDSTIVAYDCYVRLDVDGDGFAERRHIVLLGESERKKVYDDYCDDTPIASFRPYLLPHVLTGGSQAEATVEIQRIESHMWRDVLDSLKASIFPRTAFVEGQANVDDILNTELGAAIRMRAPGMVQPLTVPFVGQQALPVFDRLDQVKEARTGVSKASMVMSGDALQSTTQIAAAATVGASQAQVEMVARVFAETGMKRLMRGILRMMIQHRDGMVLVRLRDRTLADIDPAAFDIDMDVCVNVALGQGTPDERFARLSKILDYQTTAIMQLGPDNPLVSLVEMRHTLGRLTALAGERDIGSYWRDTKTVIEQTPPEEPEPSAEERLADVQREAITADTEKKGAELELRALELQLLDDRERDRLDADVALRSREMGLKYGTQVDNAELNAQLERRRIDSQEAIALMSRSRSE